MSSLRTDGPPASQDKEGKARREKEKEERSMPKEVDPVRYKPALVRLLIGNTSERLSHTTPGGLTHKWVLFVRPCRDSPSPRFTDRSLIRKVTFRLHDTFKNPVRTLREPPFEINEKGYGGFTINIRIVFNEVERPIDLIYDLNLSTAERFKEFSKEYTMELQHTSPEVRKRIRQYCPSLKAATSTSKITLPSSNDDNKSGGVPKPLLGQDKHAVADELKHKGGGGLSKSSDASREALKAKDKVGSLKELKKEFGALAYELKKVQTLLTPAAADDKPRTSQQRRNEEVQKRRSKSRERNTESEKQSHSHKAISKDQKEPEAVREPLKAQPEAEKQSKSSHQIPARAQENELAGKKLHSMKPDSKQKSGVEGLSESRKTGLPEKTSKPGNNIERKDPKKEPEVPPAIDQQKGSDKHQQRANEERRERKRKRSNSIEGKSKSEHLLRGPPTNKDKELSSASKLHSEASRSRPCLQQSGGPLDRERAAPIQPDPKKGSVSDEVHASDGLATTEERRSRLKRSLRKLDNPEKVFAVAELLIELHPECVSMEEEALSMGINFDGVGEAALQSLEHMLESRSRQPSVKLGPEPLASDSLPWLSNNSSSLSDLDLFEM